jgi:hypothetical protein
MSIWAGKFERDHASRGAGAHEETRLHGHFGTLPHAPNSDGSALCYPQHVGSRRDLRLETTGRVCAWENGVSTSRWRASRVPRLPENGNLEAVYRANQQASAQSECSVE